MLVKKFSLVRLCTATIFLVGFSTAYADDYVKNGMPCLSGVCVGDDIVNLKSINWKPAVSDMGRPLASITPDILGKNRMTEVSKFFPPQIDKAELESIAPYISLGRLDSNGIELLTKIKVFCEPPEGLDASFVSESGNHTRVSFRIFQNLNGIPSIRVRGISRHFSNNLSKHELAEIEDELAKRYAKVKNESYDLPNKATWYYQSGTYLLALRAPSVDLARNLKLFMESPGCRGTSKLD